MNLKNRQKFGRRVKSTGLIAAVLLGVLLLNVGMTALSRGRLWYADMTADDFYTVSDVAITRLEETFEKVNADRRAKGQENVKVDIIFCADPDMLKANEWMRCVYYTALNLEKEFPDTVAVSTVNVWENPSAVDAYRSNSYSAIYQSNIIIASGSEFRVTNAKTYFTYDTDTENNSEPWAYSGERKFVQFISAVTKAEAPICGITYNHGEPFDPNAPREEQQYKELLNIIEDAGYEIQFLDLEREEIPEDCRLLLTLDPQTDFKSKKQSELGVSERSKLDEFLRVDKTMEQANSYMVLVDADTPKLPNLESILSEWGIRMGRYYSEDNELLGNYRVESTASLDSLGLSVIGSYESEGVGATITENLQDVGGSPKVVFGNAMPILYSKIYEPTFVVADEENGTGAFTYGYYYKNGHSRGMYDMFRTGADDLATAKVIRDGQIVTDENGNPIEDTRGDYKLMTVTKESILIGEGQGYTNVTESAYVVAIGSTEFASDKMLSSNAYGNTDLLLETLRSIGREVVPVGMDFKTLYEDEITQTSTTTGEAYYTERSNTVWTAVLIALPAVCFTVAGVVILVKRRTKT